MEMNMTPEGNVKSWVKARILKRYGDKAWIVTTHQGPYGQKGVMDLICCIHGLFVGIEVKTVTGTLTELQKGALKKVERAGGISTEIYGKDERILNEIFAMIDEVVNMIHA